MIDWFRPPRILVLEDDEAIAALVAEGLREDNCDVICATTCAKARALWQSGDLDLLVIDVRVPDGNGLELAIDIRRSSDVGIIIITGEGQETDRVIGLELGADDYIIKPFRVRELRARVKALLRRLSPSESRTRGREPPFAKPEMAFHEYRLLPQSRQVKDASDNPVALTTLEFDLLLLLAENKNKVLTREALSRSLRGGAWDAEDRSIDGLVARLRRKLFDDESAAYKIKTIRGRGYMLAE